MGPGSFRKCMENSRLPVAWGDGGYAGKLIDWAVNFGRWVSQIVERSKGAKGFAVLPRRWMVERTLWNDRCKVRALGAACFLAKPRAGRCVFPHRRDMEPPALKVSLVQ